jgi:hypothetical protein
MPGSQRADGIDIGIIFNINIIKLGPLELCHPLSSANPIGHRYGPTRGQTPSLLVYFQNKRAFAKWLGCIILLAYQQGGRLPRMCTLL